MKPGYEFTLYKVLPYGGNSTNSCGFSMQGLAVGRGSRDANSALKLGCGITVTCERFTGTVKQEDIL
jgi:hypothetical protein